jgi:Protein of unknown function (DUF2934)
MPTPSIPNKVLQSELARVDEKIRRRAYDLYEQRGRRGGHEMDDWLQAEAEVTAKKSTKKRAINEQQRVAGPGGAEST